ncbi:amino acid ABC transporter permease [Carnimonas bestiolae]|uniref:amino acid ABC transporter permease n=1 Tax=Carnimonas bestiolae TaxID=3402172 RepID=UPI003EDBBC88
MIFDLDTFFTSLIDILDAVPRTLFMAIAVLFFSIVVGGLLASMKLFGGPILRLIPTLYVGYVRAMPMIIHLYLISQLLERNVPGTDLTQLPVVIAIYSLYVGASQTENIRAALLSIDRGQFDAGYSIGMDRTQNLLHVVFPQALRVALPVFMNTYLTIIKGLSLIFVIGAVDIFARAQLEAANNFAYIESYLAAALIYWVLSVVLTMLVTRAERFFSKHVAVTD